MSGRCLRRAALALLLSGARAALADPGDDEGSGDPEYARGRQAIEAKDWRSAVRLLSSAALRDTRNADIQNYLGRSEERRVGKECRSRWSPYH